MTTKKIKYYETDLATPIQTFLISQGFIVHSEVRHCDIVATKNDRLVVIELKLSCSINLLIQATKRQQITNDVYLAFPKPNSREMRSSRWKEVLQLIKRLELGLLLVSLTTLPPSVEIIFHPLPCQPKRKPHERQAILEEIAGRFEDYNRAGSTQRKIYTAYREEAIFISCCLAKFGALSPQALRKLGASPKAGSILSHNYYDWFERVTHGIYNLKPLGKKALSEYPELTRKINAKLDALC